MFEALLFVGFLIVVVALLSTLSRRDPGLHVDELSTKATAASSELERDVPKPSTEGVASTGELVSELEQAIASFGTKRTKELAVLYHRLGNVHEKAGNRGAALGAYDAAFKLDLTNVPILRDLGRLTHSTGDFDRAHKTFRALLLQNFGPDAGITKGDVYFYLGDISAQQDDKAKAIAMLERALAEEEHHERASALLARVKR